MQAVICKKELLVFVYNSCFCVSCCYVYIAYKKRYLVILIERSPKHIRECIYIIVADFDNLRFSLKAGKGVVVVLVGMDKPALTLERL